MPACPVNKARTMPIAPQERDLKGSVPPPQAFSLRQTCLPQQFQWVLRVPLFEIALMDAPHADVADAKLFESAIRAGRYM